MARFPQVFSYPLDTIIRPRLMFIKFLELPVTSRPLEVRAWVRGRVRAWVRARGVHFSPLSCGSILELPVARQPLFFFCFFFFFCCFAAAARHVTTVSFTAFLFLFLLPLFFSFFFYRFSFSFSFQLVLNRAHRHASDHFFCRFFLAAAGDSTHRHGLLRAYSLRHFPRILCALPPAAPAHPGEIFLLLSFR
jgi:hypothetical protein